MMTIPTLFGDRAECCGCGACASACPKGAITLSEDECGFLYPSIDAGRCVGCGACLRACAFQNVEEKNVPLAACAAVNRDRARAEQSASGGVFAALATGVLERGGVVFGAAFAEDWRVKCLPVQDIASLPRLQGSKYVQCETGTAYRQAKEYLRGGREVLYSGVPCQIAGLKSFLGKDFENLTTVDIVCHGVPSGRMLRDYIASLEAKLGGAAEAFTFRDKALGWGKNGSVTVGGRKRTLWESESPYLYYFARGWLSRESCAACKYACAHRPGDITLGDYWGIERQHPELLGRGGWDERRGISCVLANTPKGVAALDCPGLDQRPTEFEKIAAGNAQLRHPCAPGQREAVHKTYAEAGWTGLAARFEKNIGIHRYASRAKALLPAGLKRFLKGRRG